MSEEKVVFPSNSHKTKDQPRPEERKIEKIVSGKVIQQKKSLGKRFAEIFIGDDTKSVGEYILHDVLVPSAKSMICDMIGWGGFAEILLFGQKSGKNTRRDGGRSYTSYGSYYKSTDRDRGRGDDRRDISRASRIRHDFDEIVLETRGEAEDVLSHLVDLCMDYGMASVADLYDLVGITPNFTDNKFGWTNMHDASVSRVRGGYLINLPKVVALD